MSVGLFLSKLADRAHEKAEQQRQEAHAANQDQINMYKGVLSNPMSTPTQRQVATDNLNKLYPQQSKGVDSPFTKILGVMNHLGGKAQASGQGANTPLNTPTSNAPNAISSTPSLGLPTLDAAGASDASGGTGAGGGDASSAPAPSAPQASPAASPAASSPPPKPLPSLDGGQSQSFDSGAAGGTAPSQPATNLTGSGSDTVQPAKQGFLSRIAGGLQKGLSTLTPSAPETGVQMNAEDFPSPIPAPLKFDTQNIIKGADLPDDAVDRFGHPKDDTKNYVGAPDPRGTTIIGGRPFTVQPFTPKPSSSARPVYSSNAISQKTAAEEEAKGANFGKDVFSGVPITSKDLGPDEKIVQVSNVGGKNGYTIMSQKQLQRTIANQVVGMGEFGQQDLSGANVLGPKNVGQSSTSEHPYTNADTGQTTLIRQQSTRTPNTGHLNLPGLSPSSTTTQGLPPLAPPPQTGTVNSAPAAVPAQASPQTNPRISAPQSTGGAGGRVLPNLIPTGQAKGLRDRNTALNGTTTALENGLRPDPGTGQSYLDLFKPENTQQRQKVANFIRLNDSIAEGEYDRAAGEGSIAGLASFSLGIPQAVAASKNKQLQEAFDAIKNDPQAQADVAHYYNQIGQIGGMRKATGASSGQWSFNTLKQEVPNPETDGDLSIVKTKYNNLIREVKNNSGANLKARPFDQNLVNGLNGPPPKNNAPSFTVLHEGNKSWRIPTSDVSDFKQDHPNAK
jgi:hypothetical protein